MIEIGFLIGSIIAGLLLLVCIGVLIFSIWDDDTAGKVIAIVFGVAIACLYGFMTYPLDIGKYHSYHPVSGTVSQVSSRLVGEDKSVNQKFVVIFDGNSQEYGCDDTRCAFVKPGDSLSLQCIRVFIYAGTDGYDCNFVSREGK